MALTRSAAHVLRTIAGSVRSTTLQTLAVLLCLGLQPAVAGQLEPNSVANAKDIACGGRSLLWVVVRNPSVGTLRNTILELEMVRLVVGDNELSLDPCAQPARLELNGDRLHSVLVNRFGSDKQVRRFVEYRSFQAPLTIEQLSVRTKEELLSKYFRCIAPSSRRVFVTDSGPAQIRSNWSAFVALLIELELRPTLGDVVPLLAAGPTGDASECVDAGKSS